MNKKFIKFGASFAVMLLMLAVIMPSVALGQARYGSIFSGTGTNGALTVVFPAASGRIMLQNATYTLAGATTFTTHERAFPEVWTTANNPTAAASTALVVRVGSDGLVAGKTLAANVIVFVADTSTNYNGTQYAIVTTVGNTTTNIGTNELGATVNYTCTLGLGSTVTCATNDKVYVATSSDILSAAGSGAASNLLYQGIGAPNCPVSIRLAHTGTTTITYGTYEVWP